MGRHRVKAEALLLAAAGVVAKYVERLGLSGWQIDVELVGSSYLAKSCSLSPDEVVYAACSSDAVDGKATIMVNSAVHWDLPNSDQRENSLEEVMVHEMWHIVENDSGVEAAIQRVAASARQVSAKDMSENLVTHIQNLSGAQHDLCRRVATALVWGS